MGQEICFECGGRKTIECPECGGTGREKVSTLLKVQMNGLGIKHPCPECEGSGRKECDECGGKGYRVFY